MFFILSKLKKFSPALFFPNLFFHNFNVINNIFIIYKKPMVKFSNKGKGKPSKRKTLKTKYKIERKVKQHRKKMRKEARKLGKKGVKPRRNQQNNALPNSFPFKNQILQHFKSQKPTQQHSPTQDLSPAEWGMFAIEPKVTYFPRDKDHLTKKYISNEQRIWGHANLMIEVLDARNVEACIEEKFRNQCLKRGIKLITVVAKTDTVSFNHLKKAIQFLQGKGGVVVEFTTDNKKKTAALENLIKAIKDIPVQGKKRCIVVGKANTGKHTILKHFMKMAKFHNEDYATLSDVEVCEGVNIVDTPYKINDDTKYPLFWPPSNLLEESVMLQEETVLKKLFFSGLKTNRNQILMHFGIQDYTSLDDFLKKVGKANRTFGKGGMVDVGGVRENILKAWYSGKLNHLFE